MRTVGLKVLGTVLLVYFACVSLSRASTFVLMSESDLAARSVAAVAGRVTAIVSAPDAASGGINTYVHIEPDDVVFGSLPAGPLVLREPGGRLRDRTEWIFGSPEYRVGEDVLVFLSVNADGTLRTTGMAMGKFTIESDGRGALNALRTLGEGAAVWNLRRGALVEDPAPEVYDAKALIDSVRATRALRSFIRRGQVRTVPAELARITEREPHVAFTYLSNPSRWFEPDAAEPVSYQIDAAGDVGIGPTDSRAAVLDAFAAWSNVATSDLTLADAGPLAAPLAFAGCAAGNRISFNDVFDEVTDPVGCSGVLAIGGYCASSETRVVNGTNFRRIRVGKITFNDGWSRCPGWNRCNVSEVVTHELGHTLGFGHSTDWSATMAASAHFDGRCAALQSDDLAAINFVYPNMVGSTPSPSATPVPPTATATRTLTAHAARVRLGRPAIHGNMVRLPVYVRAPAPYSALDLQVAYDPERVTPTGVALRRPTDSGLTNFHVGQAGLLHVAMASGEPIKRRVAMLLHLEFTLADGMDDPGAIRALAATLDELPVTVATDGLAR